MFIVDRLFKKKMHGVIEPRGSSFLREQASEPANQDRQNALLFSVICDNNGVVFVVVVVVDVITIVGVVVSLLLLDGQQQQQQQQSSLATARYKKAAAPCLFEHPAFACLNGWLLPRDPVALSRFQPGAGIGLRNSCAVPGQEILYFPLPPLPVPLFTSRPTAPGGCLRSYNALLFTV